MQALQNGRLWVIRLRGRKLKELDGRPRLYVSERTAKSTATSLAKWEGLCEVIEVAIVEMKP